MLAVSNLVRMGVKASDIKYNKAESVDEAILRGRDYEYDENQYDKERNQQEDEALLDIKMALTESMGDTSTVEDRVWADKIQKRIEAEAYGLAGLPEDDDYGEDSGSAYVFTFLNGEWVFDSKLYSNDLDEGDFLTRCRLAVEF